MLAMLQICAMHANLSNTGSVVSQNSTRKIANHKSTALEPQLLFAQLKEKIDITLMQIQPFLPQLITYLQILITSQ